MPCSYPCQIHFMIHTKRGALCYLESHRVMKFPTCFPFTIDMRNLLSLQVSLKFIRSFDKIALSSNDLRSCFLSGLCETNKMNYNSFWSFDICTVQFAWYLCLNIYYLRASVSDLLSLYCILHSYARTCRYWIPHLLKLLPWRPRIVISNFKWSLLFFIFLFHLFGE